MKCIMPLIRGPSPLSYRRLGGDELDVITTLELDPCQVERYLGPIADIQAAVRRGPAHSMVAIEASGAAVGFYVVHPDRRDRSCWWLGWFAVDLRQQGRGFGSLAMQAVIDHLRRVSGCRRLRLFVAPENLRARGLYDRAGFRWIGCLPSTGEVILELALWLAEEADQYLEYVLAIIAAGTQRAFRHRRLRYAAGPHAARVIGVERGPPQGRRLLHPTAEFPQHGTVRLNRSALPGMAAAGAPT